MKFPIDIEAWTQEYAQTYPDDKSSVSFLRDFLQMLNKAYSKGFEDAKAEVA